MADRAPAIEFRDVSKHFGRATALDGLTMSVDPGQVHGFLGPNGAGKSTAIRILLGLLRPDGGTARLLGGDPFRDAPTLHRRIAYVPGDVSLWPTLTGGECIDVLTRARGGVDPARRDALIERFQLDPRTRARTYSKGNRQKVALVAALATDADLLLLDEPTSGLDPLMERVFTDVIRERHRAGCTVLLSSHILSEVEALCDHVTLIRQGRVERTGELSELRHLHRVAITADVAGGVPEGLDRLAGVSGLRIEGHQIRLEVTAAGLATVLGRLGQAGATSIAATPPTLEELFLSSYDAAPAAGA